MLTKDQSVKINHAQPLGLIGLTYASAYVSGNEKIQAAMDVAKKVLDKHPARYYASADLVCEIEKEGVFLSKKDMSMALYALDQCGHAVREKRSENGKDVMYYRARQKSLEDKNNQAIKSIICEISKGEEMNSNSQAELTLKKGEVISWSPSARQNTNKITGEVIAIVKAGESAFEHVPANLKAKAARNFKDVSRFDRVVVATETPGRIYAPELRKLGVHAAVFNDDSSKKNINLDSSMPDKKADPWEPVSKMHFIEAMDYVSNIRDGLGLEPPVWVLKKLLYRAMLEIEYANMLKNSIARLINTRPVSPA